MSSKATHRPLRNFTRVVTLQPANEDKFGRESADPPPSSCTSAPLTVETSIRWPQSAPAAPFKLKHILLTSHRPGGPRKPSGTGGLGNIVPELAVEPCNLNSTPRRGTATVERPTTSTNTPVTSSS
ncbi:hypothetical protein CABS01_14981 [Colletotrichum abscissum]|uniref:uncharacterized protein n=1 Tax=Colletotrichum abscissum TaxID=1671311 RepID=UPI0027D5A957|nr:uncharacterized protein CABS01_14981 [Colletotrichum abscissum]KAK1477514.1 hypothetical protein CABS01_14981 [Colletotrichum abscissum]